MTITIIMLVVALAAILGAVVPFTNSVGILGERLNVGHGAAGSVLAAHTRDPAFSSSAYYCRSFYSEEEG